MFDDFVYQRDIDDTLKNGIRKTGKFPSDYRYANTVTTIEKYLNMLTVLVKNIALGMITF